MDAKISNVLTVKAIAQVRDDSLLLRFCFEVESSFQWALLDHGEPLKLMLHSMTTGIRSWTALLIVLMA